MLYNILKVHENLSLELAEDWNWNDDKGRIVAIKYLDVMPDRNIVLSKLVNLLTDNCVDLRNPLNLDTGCLYCDVYLNGINIIDFLREDC
ncbi:MAG TPA: hypothetical protein PLD62_03010 [Candidatus Cloacimonadota bacterium]|nr:hypothetical protein [Candidatus Cloacimonadota bacterium]